MSKLHPVDFQSQRSFWLSLILISHFVWIIQPFWPPGGYNTCDSRACKVNEWLTEYIHYSMLSRSSKRRVEAVLQIINLQKSNIQYFIKLLLYKSTGKNNMTYSLKLELQVMWPHPSTHLCYRSCDHILLLIYVTGHVPTSCPLGWFYYSYHCYYYSKVRTDFFEAQTHCHQMESELVVINTAEENVRQCDKY